MTRLRVLMVTVLTLVLFVAAHTWQDAIVINVSETELSGGARSDKNVMHYTVETEDTVYFLDYSYNPGRKDSHAPDLAVNVRTKIAVEGRSAYLLDANGKEVKLHVAKKKKNAEPET